jgi:PncC family amidohydrolase
MTRPEAVEALEACRARGLTLATAESCTGGMVSEWLTEIPGSSAVVRGGVVAYADDVKAALLGVSEQTLDRHGAVSRETAIEMARGVRAALGADVGVSITGVAGPDGGTPDKPVGRVELSVAAPQGERGLRLDLGGDRASIREQSARAALELVVTLLREN